MTPREFWIDVGGTFTDCFAPQARRHARPTQAALLGRDERRDRRGLDDARRSSIPLAAPTRPTFGAATCCACSTTRAARSPNVASTSFDAATGTLTLDAPLPRSRTVGRRYELTAGEESVVLAIRYLLGLRLDEPIPPVVVRLGTTRGTNALLTRRGARTAFVTTRGFADVLRIGYQNRPRLFDLRVVKPAPLFAAVVEIDERIDRRRRRCCARPTKPRVRRDLLALHEPRHRVAGHLPAARLSLIRRTNNSSAASPREVGFNEISLSQPRRAADQDRRPRRHDGRRCVSQPGACASYVSRLAHDARLPDSLRIMTSAGGLVAAEHFVGKDSILSGPAGGVVGMARAAQAAGFTRAIGFDMGGTSTDVARFDGRFELEYETEKAGVRIVAPMTSIDTVAAGGGSICRVRRREARRRARQRRRRSRPGLLRPRRTALRHRSELPPRQDSARALSVSARSRAPSIADLRSSSKQIAARDRQALRRPSNFATASCASPTPTWPRRFKP